MSPLYHVISLLVHLAVPLTGAGQSYDVRRPGPGAAGYDRVGEAAVRYSGPDGNGDARRQDGDDRRPPAPDYSGGGGGGNDAFRRSDAAGRYTTSGTTTGLRQETTTKKPDPKYYYGGHFEGMYSLGYIGCNIGCSALRPTENSRKTLRLHVPTGWFSRF